MDIIEYIDLRDHTMEELKGLMAAMGERPYRASQVYAWLYSRDISTIDEMSDLKLEFREGLKALYSLTEPVIGKKLSSIDGTIKFETILSDGSSIESVLIPEGERLTLCLSTQTGCPLGCAFCRTGDAGAGRNLSLSELAGQMIAARRLAAESGDTVTNVVLMGMGEPLLNYDNLKRFLDILTDQKGFSIPPRRVTVSTAGLPAEIERLGIETKVNLAVSLNATTEEVRSRIMPINKKYSLKELLTVLRSYPSSKSRFITIEYVLIRELNDSLEDARRLGRLLRNIRCKINLIPLNPGASDGLLPPTEAQVAAFKDILYKSGYVAVTRLSKGADILAACGQLATEVKPVPLDRDIEERVI